MDSMNDQQCSKTRTPGQIAYEMELEIWPLYEDGTPRKQWHELDALAQGTWEKNPTPRKRTGYRRAD